MSHRRRKAPRKQGGFSWSRVPDSPSRGFTSYRLFRRDIEGRCHMDGGNYTPGAETRADFARRLWAARIRLRDHVDTLDLARLGVTA